MRNVLRQGIEDRIRTNHVTDAICAERTTKNCAGIKSEQSSVKTVFRWIKSGAKVTD